METGDTYNKDKDASPDRSFGVLNQDSSTDLQQIVTNSDARRETSQLTFSLGGHPGTFTREESKWTRLK
jgi:hypothetical protein